MSGSAQAGAQGPGVAEGALGPGAPEAALQLALDLTSLDAAADLVSRLTPQLSRIEIGTPLALAAEAGVPVDLCIHRPKQASPSFDELIGPVVGQRMTFDQMVVAGKLAPADVRAALAAGFGTLIVGSAITGADDPAATWDSFRAEVRASASPVKS
jgi:3-keto-L-gulonate-6-phosphate decarboxylase